MASGYLVLTGEGELFMWSPLRVGELLDLPHVKIVLNTNWVRVFGFEKTRDFLPDAPRRPVIGKTMFSLSYSSNYRQISNYTGSDNAGANWLAMETDSGDGYPGHFDNLVHTHGTTGLSDPDVLALLMAARLAKA